MLRAWWAVADVSGNGGIDHDEYITLSCKICKAFSVDEYDLAEAVEAAERDWISDSDNGAPLNRTQFEAALFELADVYTDSLEEDE